MLRWFINEDCIWCCWRHYFSCHHTFAMLSLVKSNYKLALKDFVIFILCFILYGLNEVYLKKLDTNIHWFFSGYYNDFLASIIFLSYSNILTTVFMKKLFLDFVWLSLFIFMVGSAESLK